ncbi:uncharacterized protein LOC129777787 [Toxorhynchites rutilus septentrionalis]|uniref:uncharacterized protein LOC129777779 n=1 Tax=Toxorhynchites rutilus septentrionalis TaxID=329112 RepID=UPI002478E796|nr:uncharacterized protein LOC129777779 [Toxorhynchites rutilus septentrionalis]XP_055640246.1 uncharacterized protein LOC129777787 [Toxorhynchites rutilus septentrionalis]
MKLIAIGVILATIGFNAINALKCMQGIEVSKGDNNEVQKSDNPLEITECGATAAVSSTALLFAVKPSIISFPSGDYKCYHLKYEEKNSDTSTIIKGCIYNSLNVCDGKYSSSNTKESFCSQCDMDGCNSGERFAFDFKLLGLTLVALVAYLVK